MTIAAGAKINGWLVLSVSPDSRKAICACDGCGDTRILAVAALEAGEAAPHDCRPLTPERLWRAREEIAERKRRRDMKDSWKPRG